MAATILSRRLCQGVRQSSGLFVATCRSLRPSSEAPGAAGAMSGAVNSTAMIDSVVIDRRVSSPSLSPSPSPSPSSSPSLKTGHGDFDFPSPSSSPSLKTGHGDFDFHLHHQGQGLHLTSPIYGTAAVRTVNMPPAGITSREGMLMATGQNTLRVSGGGICNAMRDGQDVVCDSHATSAVTAGPLLSPWQQQQRQQLKSSALVADSKYWGRDKSSRGVHQVRGPKGAAAEALIDDDVSGYNSSDEAEAEEWDSLRRTLSSPFYGGITPRALLVDAAGTLIIPTESMTKVYVDIGKKYGVTMPEAEMLHRYRWAYAQPWGQKSLRYEDDGRHFWREVVGFSTGCYDPNYFEELYNYYATAEAWKLVDEESARIFEAMKASGLKIGVVSNFDTRLRPVLKELGCYHWFDTIAVSAEVRAEKPNPVIFLHACEQLGIEPHEAVHVGDDRRNDVWGARDAGCHAWLWGSDVFSFKEVAELLGVDVRGCEHERLVA